MAGSVCVLYPGRSKWIAGNSFHQLKKQVITYVLTQNSSMVWTWIHFLRLLKRFSSSQPDELTIENGYITCCLQCHIWQPEAISLCPVYDKGWNVYLNGKKASYDLIDNCMYSIPLEKVKTTIEMKYTCPVLYAGIAVSVFGILLTITVTLAENKKRRFKKWFLWLYHVLMKKNPFLFFIRKRLLSFQKWTVTMNLFFVNDGSRDRTLEILKNFQKRSPCDLSFFSRNFGKEAAMYAGFCNAGGDYVAVMDADLQDPPSLLPEMMKNWNPANMTVLLQDVSAVTVSHPSGAFCPEILSDHQQDLRCGYCWRCQRFPPDETQHGGCHHLHEQIQPFPKESSDGSVSSTYWLPYKNVERSRWDKMEFWKLLNMQSAASLIFPGSPDYCFLVRDCHDRIFFPHDTSYYYYKKLIFDDPVQGWASIICVIIFIGGLQLFCLGIMGQYIAKTYMEVKHRPHYIISGSLIRRTLLPYTDLSILSAALPPWYLRGRGPAEFFFTSLVFIRRLEVLIHGWHPKYFSSSTSLSITRWTLFLLSKISPIRLSEPGVMFRYSSICSPSAKKALLFRSVWTETSS